MEQININMQFLDKGYGIKYFTQTVLYGSGSIEFIVQSLKEEEKVRADTIVERGWEWVCKNQLKIKDYLSIELAKEFETMRLNKEKNVPEDDVVMLRRKLHGTDISGITFYPEQAAFTVDFMGQFNGYTYKMYVSLNDDFTFKTGSILTMGGFQPPKVEEKPNLKKATALYDYHLRHKNEACLYKYYTALPKKEIDAFIDLFIANETGEKERDLIDLPLYLALFSHACGEKLPDKLYSHLIAEKIFYYGEIYLRADEKFADELIKKLGEVEDDEVNHILCALAMIPCKRVNDFFIKNSCTPLPAWAEKRYILPKEYAKVGGWETTENGPHMLFDEKVTAFVRCKKKDSSPLLPVTSLSATCGLCGQPLTLVFDEANKLAACLHCACYQTIFTKTDETGVHWHLANTTGDFFQKYPQYMKNDENIAARFEYGMKPSTEKRRATWTANEFASITRTQIGGMPTAINDIEYPICPDCGKTMRFAAQFDMADIEDGEGLYYFFVCDDCNVTGTNYGQS